MFEEERGWPPIGRATSTRTTDDGIWVQAQLDKRAAWYNRSRARLDADALGWSAGSAEHSVRWDEATGEILRWPLHEISLTPTPANPLAVIAARSAEAARFLAIAAGTPPVRDGWDAASGADILACVLRLLAVEQAEGDAADVAILQRAVDALTEFVGSESAEAPESEPMPEPAVMSATRAGRRNSAADETMLTTAHDAIASVLSMPCAPGPDEPAVMSADAEPQPAVLAVRGDVVDLARRLDEVAERTVRRLLG